jgi:hypothetical protein
MKQLPFYLAFIAAMFFSSFQKQQEVQLVLASKIKNNGLALKELKTLQRIELTDPQTRFISCDMFVMPANHKEPKEVHLNTPDVANLAELKGLVSSLAVGDKVYFDKIEVLRPTGSQQTLAPVAFKIQ